MLETVKEFKYVMIIHAAALAVFSTLPGVFNRFVGEYFITFDNPLIFIMALIFPTITALGVFSYLFRSNAAAFYNSMPYTRCAMYLSKYAAGLIICLLPLVFIFAANSVLYVIYGVGKNDATLYGDMLLGLGKTALSYISVLSLGAFAASVSGSVVAALCMSGALTLGKTLAVVSLFFSFNMWFDDIFINASGFGFPPTNFFIISAFENKVMESGEYVHAFLYAAIFFAAGLAFYIIRKAERRGFYAFTWVNVCFKYAVSMIFSLVLGYVFLSASDKNVLIGYIGYTMTLFIVFYAVQAAQSGGFKGIFKNIRSFAIFAAVWLAVVAIPLNLPIERIILDMPVRGEVSFDYAFAEGMKFRSKEIRDILNSNPPSAAREVFKISRNGIIIHGDTSEIESFTETLIKTPDFTITAEKMRKCGEDTVVEWIEGSEEYRKNVLDFLSPEKPHVMMWVNIYRDNVNVNLSSDGEFVKLLREDIENHTYEEYKEGEVFGWAETDDNIIFIYDCYEDTINYINRRTGGKVQ